MLEFPATFRISSLIRITLTSLYLGLTVPLPFLAAATAASIPPQVLWIALAIGLLILYGALSERVIVDARSIQVAYPNWFVFRRGWELNWSDIKDLKLRTTGQGGLVYYFVTAARDRAYLLPMRIAGFARLVKIVEERTGIDTSDVRPLSQPWMYLTLLMLTIFLGWVDIWTIKTTSSLSFFK
jgi:hypothetical protein